MYSQWVFGCAAHRAVSQGLLTFMWSFLVFTVHYYIKLCDPHNFSRKSRDYHYPCLTCSLAGAVRVVTCPKHTAPEGGPQTQLV